MSASQLLKCSKPSTVILNQITGRILSASDGSLTEPAISGTGSAYGTLLAWDLYNRYIGEASYGAAGEPVK